MFTMDSSSQSLLDVQWHPSGGSGRVRVSIPTNSTCMITDIKDMGYKHIDDEIYAKDGSLEGFEKAILRIHREHQISLPNQPLDSSLLALDIDERRNPFSQ